MPKKEKLPLRVDQTMVQIAAILARGFVKYKRSRRPAANPASIESDVNQPEVSIKHLSPYPYWYWLSKNTVYLAEARVVILDNQVVSY